jgi:hypothetical protein
MTYQTDFRPSRPLQAISFLFGIAGALAVVDCGSSSDSGGPSGLDSGSSGGDASEGATDSAAPTSDGAATACVTIGPPQAVSLPHVEATGTQAQAVVSAVSAIFAAQAPPVDPGASSYSFSSVDCGDLSTPFESGYQCSIALDSDGGTVNVEDSMSSGDGGAQPLAQNLYSALGAAGAMACQDPAHGDFIRLQDVAATASDLKFTDISKYDTVTAVWTPNLVVQGADAAGVIAALAAAGIHDCDPSRFLSLVCSTSDPSTPAGCGYGFQPLVDVNGSYLNDTCDPDVPVDAGCVPGTSDDGGGCVVDPFSLTQLGASQAAAIWGSILTAAKDAGFQPLNGTVAQATVLNAAAFTWDGTTLRFNLTVDDAVPPPSPSGGEDGGDDEGGQGASPAPPPGP